MRLKLLFILPISLILSNCAHQKVPAWDGKIYVGSVQSQGLVRTQSGEVIKVTDPKFGDYAAMSYDDLRSFYQVFVLGCKEWRAGPSKIRIEDLLENNRPQISKAEPQAARKATP